MNLPNTGPQPGFFVCVCVCGGGGGAYLKKGDQIFNVVVIRYASSEDTQESVQPTDQLKWGQLLMVRETFASF